MNIINNITDNINIHCAMPAFTREEERQASARMVSDFLAMVKPGRKGRCRWKASKRDLMEIVYTIWQMGIIRDSTGNPASLKNLVHDFFSILSVAEPRNIYCTAKRAMERKGVQNDTMTNRYCWMINVRKIDNPMACAMISVDNSSNGIAATWDGTL